MEKTVGELSDKVCKTCGISFPPRNASDKRIYCSKRCYGDAVVGTKKPLGIGVKISVAKQMKSKRVPIPCEICGTIMLLTPTEQRYRRTCSRKCVGQLVSQRLKEMWKNPPQSMVDKMRAKAVERRGYGRLEKETKPERLFREELERRGIKFEPQFAYDGMLVADFFIPYLQAFIFCDGSYWHGLTSAKEKDKQQVMYVRARGLHAYRFSDVDIYENVGACVDTVLDDADQPFSIGEVIDKLTIMVIKNNRSSGDKLVQSIKDYRRMERVALAGLEHHHVNDPDVALKLMVRLTQINEEIYKMVEIVESGLHTLEDAVTMQTLIKERSVVKNALNTVFGETRQEIKVYGSDHA